MSIEINNESGVEVDEAALAELGRFVLDAHAASTRWPSCRSLLVDADTMAALHQQWMDLPGPDRRDGLPDGRRRRPGRARATRRRRPAPTTARRGACSATSCCAPTVAADQAASAGHSHRGRAAPAVHARHPAPARLRPRRARRGARDVRAAGQLVARVGRGDRPRPDPAPRCPAPAARSATSAVATGTRPTGDRADIVALVVAIVPRPARRRCSPASTRRWPGCRWRGSRSSCARTARAPSALRAIIADRARYTNLLLLLRVTCELTATVLVTIVARVAVRHALAGAAADRRWSWSSSATRSSASARARSAASTPTASRWPAPARCGCSAGCSARWPRC